MARITTCTTCGCAYEELSEEAANDPNRLCMTCFDRASNHDERCDCQTCKKWHALMGPER